MSPSLPLRLGLVALALLLAQGASAQLRNDIDLDGPDKLTTALKGRLHVGDSVKAKVTEVSNGTLEIDGADNVSYSNADGFEFTGSIDRSGKKPVLVLGPADIDALEDEIGDLMEAALAPRCCFNVTLDATKLKSKLSGKGKDGFVFAKLGLRGTFTAIHHGGSYTGKLALAARVTDKPQCTVCGNNFVGAESFKQSLKGCGSLSGSANGAELQIAADPDNDGASTFTYTDTDGTVLMGSLSQRGKKFSCMLDPGVDGVGALEGALEGIILDECGVNADVDITSERCSGKPGSGGASVSFAFGVGFTASDGQQSATGSSSTKGTLLIVP